MGIRTAFCAALVLALLGFGAAGAQELKVGDRVFGKARALDGSRLLLWPDSTAFRHPADALQVRLFGIVAPGLDDWPDGAFARATLDQLLADGSNDTDCLVRRIEGEDKVAAICMPELAQMDLGRAMIVAGWAVSRRDEIGSDGSEWIGDPDPLGYLSAECSASQFKTGAWARFPAERNCYR